MASNAPIVAVSYGIGVQNRYSAFLEDEDGFGSPAVVVATLKHQQQALASKQQQQKALNSQLAKQANSNLKAANGRSVANQQHQDATNKHDQQKRAGQQAELANNKHRSQARQQNQPTNNTIQGQHPNKQHQMNGAGNRPHYQGNNNQDNTANSNNNRFAKHPSNNSNFNHQNNASHNNYHNHQRNNKENDNNGNNLQHHGRFAPRTGAPSTGNSNNQRSVRRPYFNQNHQDGSINTDRKLTGAVQDDLVTAANEEEKRRRQQKRALDLKHKDPEKRESRKQQQPFISNGENEQVDGNNAAQDGNYKNQRNRQRQGVDGEPNNIARSENNRGFRGGMVGRGGRINRRSGGEPEDGDQRRADGQQVQRGPRVPNGVPAERPGPRNRNGFGAGSRGSRGPRDEGGRIRRDSERQKPIPNFSDKLDFPSLAS